MTDPIKFQSLADLFEGEEARMTEKARAEIAAEKAAWDAMTPEEQAAQIAAIETKYPDLPEIDIDDIEDDDVEEEEE